MNICSLRMDRFMQLERTWAPDIRHRGVWAEQYIVLWGRQLWSPSDTSSSIPHPLRLVIPWALSPPTPLRGVGAEPRIFLSNFAPLGEVVGRSWGEVNPNIYLFRRSWPNFAQ